MVSKIQVVPFGSNPTSIYIGEHDPLILKSKIKNRRYMVVTSPSHMKNGNVELILSSIDRKPEAIIENVPSNPSLNFLFNKFNNFQLLDNLFFYDLLKFYYITS